MTIVIFLGAALTGIGQTPSTMPGGATTAIVGMENHNGLLYLARWNGTIKCVRVTDWATLWSRSNGRGGLESFSLDPHSGERLLTLQPGAGDTTSVTVLSKERGKKIDEFVVDLNALAVSWSLDGIWFAGFQDEGAACAYFDSSKTNHFTTLPGSTATAIAFDDQQGIALVGTDDGKIYRTRCDGGTFESQKILSDSRLVDIIAIRVLPKTSSLIVLTRQGVIHRYQYPIVKLLSAIPLKSDDLVVGCTIVSDDHLLVATESECFLILLRANHLVLLRSVSLGRGQINCTTYDGKNFLFLAAYNDGTLTAIRVNEDLGAGRLGLAKPRKISLEPAARR